MKPRELSEVIDAMLAQIPPTETSLVCGLKNIRKSICYVAPERIWHWWRLTQKMLMREIGEPREQWQLQVSYIFRGKDASK